MVQFAYLLSCALPEPVNKEMIRGKSQTYKMCNYLCVYSQFQVVHDIPGINQENGSSST